MFRGIQGGNLGMFCRLDASFGVVFYLAKARLLTPLGAVRRQVLSDRLQSIRVKIRGFVHKGLEVLYADNIAKGVPPNMVDKLRKMLAFLDDMQDPEELRSLPVWKVDTLTGARKGQWSLTVTRNRRLTFSIDIGEREYDVNLEDYH
jgi:toxin HigB-1